MSGKLILSLILIATAIVFVAQNTDIASLHFLFWTLSMSGALLYVLLLVAGALIGWLLHSYALHRRKAAKRL
ncbi:MAG: lipopolysaccharide assembly protein LapA domain-containing protein [Rhodanobacteraceae bacterium]